MSVAKCRGSWVVGVGRGYKNKLNLKIKIKTKIKNKIK